ncbi:MAG: tRNA uridine-5-carboxymethylaminomethyl(34) synthesis GTPase MnmE [Bacteroidota bacterium]|jgi:tRNA modification GTPase
MLNFRQDDTITALATPPGAGAIAIIRLSGKNAFQIGNRVFLSKGTSNIDFASRKSHTLVFGTLQDHSTVDEVVVGIYRGPSSFTGEDTLEFSCHGSVFVQQRVLDLLIGQGARMAEPGEFTLRAFLNGKLDLSQAEAVADLIASDTAAAHQVAIRQLRGGFSSLIKELRSELIRFASLIELELDFAEEDVEFANRNQLKASLDQLRNRLKRLIDSFEMGNVIKNGIPVVIAGKPNAGKSTLLNALLNEERAIVSDIAGTTRDTIEEELTLKGVKFRFIDTAGIRETTDAIERIGVDRTMEKIRQSPVIIYLFDVNETSCGDLQEQLDELRNQVNPTFLLLPVGNKIDQYETEELEAEYRSVSNVLLISAKSGTNLDMLRNTLLSRFRSGELDSGDTVVANARHVAELKKTDEALVKVLEGLEKGVSNDFVAGDLRFALHHLGLITGEISNEDLLENIFSKFCIGK